MLVLCISLLCTSFLSFLGTLGAVSLTNFNLVPIHSIVLGNYRYPNPEKTSETICLFYVCATGGVMILDVPSA
ncbi:hypothetical protein BJV78DRAFT_1184538 [Lactifluus subvellereus]|nr:hypothetical protein BJV78DRAFT_1184538 [Lactifluus subvellereus]